MTFKNPEFSSNSPYYDDFDDAKNFLKVLFKPGYAVQARELTQLQTILQSQIAKFADHVFQDGSQVFGGKIQIVNTPYARVEKTLYSITGSTPNSTDSYLSGLTDNVFKVYSKVNNIFTELATIKVVYFESSNYSENDNYPILFYNVLSVADSQNGTFQISRDHHIGLTSTGPFFKVINPNVETSNPLQYTISPFGESFIATVDEGIFYIDGYFVKTEKQTVSLFNKSYEGQSELTIDTTQEYSWAEANVRLFNKPSSRIGYEITRDVVTATQDATLKDPARGFYNHNAPGADRYRISLKLKTIDYDRQSVDIENFVNTNFIQILRTTNGVVDYIKNKSSYAQILDLFARRTEDESGSYTVKPFIADVKNHLRKDKYILTLSQSANTQFFATPTEEQPVGVNIPKTSSTPTTNNVTIKVGGYIWPATQQQRNFDPFTATSLTNLNFPVGKVVDVLPDYNPVTNTKSLKIVIELQNSRKITSSPPSVSYYFKQSPTTGTTTVIVTATEVSIDPKGAYSLSDIPQGNAGKLAITLQPGKAYVFGYEYETFAPKVVDYLIDGNQAPFKTYTGLNIDFELGNYVYGNFAQRNSNQTRDVDFEKLPLMNLVDVDTNTILIYPNSTNQVQSKILSWSSFKYTNDPTINDMVDIAKLQPSTANPNSIYPHESVLFVEKIT